jgi:cobalt/nickel transport system permease protein
MRYINGVVRDFKSLDLLAAGETATHRLDARAKVIVTLVFIVSVVSFDKYELTALFPLFIYPAVMMALGNLPAGYIAGKIVFVFPFALAVAIFNPLFDRQVMMQLGAFGISGGWISCASIVVRSILTVGAAIILVGLTGFSGICRALEQLGMPKMFAVQLLFLYRYIFVLTEEGERASRARELRSFGNKGLSLASYTSLISHLLLRTWQRAERIHMAMLARGFTGEFHTGQSNRFGWTELSFVVGWSAIFILVRFQNIPQLVGTMVMGMLS